MGNRAKLIFNNLEIKTIHQRQFYTSLEGFRGLAVLLVLISHLLINTYFPNLIFLKLGFLGVNFFFVLSGFLITEILINEIRANKKSIIKKFFIKRFLRIFPIYYLSIAILYLFDIEQIRDYIFWLLSYTYNFGLVHFDLDSNYVSHFWSLCVEEQFYLFWPFILIILHRKFNLLNVFVSIILLSIITRFVYVFSNGHNYYEFALFSTVASISALAFGALLAYSKLESPKKLIKILDYKWIPIFMSIIFFLFVYFYTDQAFLFLIFGRTFASIIAIYFIGWGVMGFNNYFIRFMEWNILKFIGKISYGLYLYHQILFYLFKKDFDTFWLYIKPSLGNFGYQKGIFSFLFFSVLSFLIAILSFYIIEKPLLSFKKQIT